MKVKTPPQGPHGDAEGHPRYLILGASYATGNMGVDALLSGTIEAILQRDPHSRIEVLDYGLKDDAYRVPGPSGDCEVAVVNLRFSWKPWLPGNVFRLLAKATLARLLPARARERVIAGDRWLSGIRRADLACSIAGGDSFSDIYGVKRLVYVAMPVLLVMAVGRPVVIMPQTLGPFSAGWAKALARAIFRRSEKVYARDRKSLDVAAGLVDLPQDRMGLCRDMGFALKPRKPAAGIPGWMADMAPDERLVGLNVSGLLHIGGYGGTNSFKLTVDYAGLIDELIDYFLAQPKVHVMLVSHVTGGAGGGESDGEACRKIHDRHADRHADRLHLHDPGVDHREIKYLIGQCDFFLGARMHSCIAALSQGIPAVGMAYSRKFDGVFDSVGVKDLVVDLRGMTQEGALDAIRSLFGERERFRAVLSETAVTARAEALGIFRSLPPAPHAVPEPARPHGELVQTA